MNVLLDKIDLRDAVGGISNVIQHCVTRQRDGMIECITASHVHDGGVTVFIDQQAVGIADLVIVVHRVSSSAGVCLVAVRW